VPLKFRWGSHLATYGIVNSRLSICTKRYLVWPSVLEPPLRLWWHRRNGTWDIPTLASLSSRSERCMVSERFVYRFLHGDEQ
jgi:hypothetical protein